jgi:ArsR family transcriptional regulator
MKLVQMYRCFCDETRLRILHLLAQGPLCVCHFQDILKLPQVAVSKHLAYLRTNALVTARRHEKWMIYSLPERTPTELGKQLLCLQDCAQSYPVFREDLKRLGRIKGQCDWVEEAVKPASKQRPCCAL